MTQTTAGQAEGTDELVQRHTAFRTMTDLVHAMARGYSPSIRNVELAAEVDAMAAAYGLRTRCFRRAAQMPALALPHLAPCSFCGGTAMHGPDCASPEMAQDAKVNPWEIAGRARKLLKLLGAIDGALLGMKVDPFSPAALAFVEAMNADAWRIACEHAPCPLASETTRAQVRAIFAERVTRAA